jgi:hypothetical protein
MESTTTYVEVNGHHYACHTTPEDRLRCGACGRGVVALGRCQKCDARVVRDENEECE